MPCEPEKREKALERLPKTISWREMDAVSSAVQSSGRYEPIVKDDLGSCRILW